MVQDCLFGAIVSIGAVKFGFYPYCMFESALCCLESIEEKS